MTKSVVGIFDQRSEAEGAVRDVIDTGFRREDVSLIGEHIDGELSELATESNIGISTTTAGAGTGAVIGGIGGLLVGLGVFAIPGVGPVIAAGPLATTLIGAGVGAAAGGLIGALVDVGVPEQEAGYYAEGIRRGSTLVSVRTDDEKMIDRAINIFERHNAVDIDRRAEEWRQSGWTGYNPNANLSTKETPARSTDLLGAVEHIGSGPHAHVRGYDAYTNDFRTHFHSWYANRGYGYDYYEPAYRYGYTLANDQRYAEKDWSAIEADAQREWEKKNKGAWQECKDSVRYAWERVKGYSPAEASARASTQSAA